MKKNKAIFLDRDGTLIYDYGYVYEIEKLKFLDGVIEGLKRAMKHHYLLIIVTNQSGIGRGYYTKDEYNKFTDVMINNLKENGILIDKVYYCPHTDDDNCICRKPKTYLFEKAIKEFNINTKNSFAIGDKERDLSICDRTEIKGILIGKSNKYISCNNFKEAIDYIIEGRKKYSYNKYGRAK